MFFFGYVILVFIGIYILVIKAHFYLSDKGSVQTQQHQSEGKSFSQRRSKSNKNYTVEHHVNGVLNGFIVKGQHSEKQQVIRNSAAKLLKVL